MDFKQLRKMQEERDMILGEIDEQDIMQRVVRLLIFVNNLVDQLIT